MPEIKSNYPTCYFNQVTLDEIRLVENQQMQLKYKIKLRQSSNKPKLREPPCSIVIENLQQ